MIAAARTVDGVWLVDPAAETVEPWDGSWEEPPRPAVSLPLVVTTAGAGAFVVALLDRRPPLAVSHDAGRTWTEAGGGLPAGRSVAVAADDPDAVLFGARNRLYISPDGGRFWRVLAPELPEIESVAWLATPPA